MRKLFGLLALAASLSACNIKQSVTVGPSDTTATTPGTSGSPPGTGGTTGTPPTCTLSANPTTVKQGGDSLLTWSSTGATSVVGNWDATIGLSGSTRIVIAATRTFQTTCTGPGGTTRSEAVTVTVSGPACPSSIDYTPAGGTITVGQTIRLTAKDWPTGVGCVPFWYVKDASRAQVTGADDTVVIDGAKYYAGVNANLKGIFAGSTEACNQTSIAIDKVFKCYTWKVVTAFLAEDFGLASADALLLRYNYLSDVRQTYHGND